MRDPVFRRSQEDGIRLPHVAPINALVDDLRQWGHGWVPAATMTLGELVEEYLRELYTHCRERQHLRTRELRETCEQITGSCRRHVEPE